MQAELLVVGIMQGDANLLFLENFKTMSLLVELQYNPDCTKTGRIKFLSYLRFASPFYFSNIFF